MSHHTATADLSLTQKWQGDMADITARYAAFQGYMGNLMQGRGRLQSISALKKILSCASHLEWRQYLYRCISQNVSRTYKWLKTSSLDRMTHRLSTPSSKPLQIWRHEDRLPLQLESISFKAALKCSWQVSVIAINCTDVHKNWWKTTPVLRRIMVLW